jgi:urease accessory protein
MTDSPEAGAGSVAIITRPRVHVDALDLAGKERDAVALTWEERRWGRRRLVTAAGRDLKLALPTGSHLHPGDVLHVDDQWYVVIEAAAEPVLEVRPRDHAEALRIAFEVGNRHFSLALEGERLLVPDDPAMRQLLDRLAVPYELRMAAYTPVGTGHAHE